MYCNYDVSASDTVQTILLPYSGNGGGVRDPKMTDNEMQDMKLAQ